MIGVIQSLSVVVCKDAAEAIQTGFTYAAGEYEPVRVDQAVVVQEGTEAGNATVDFLMSDANGKKYVFMITAALLRALPI